MSAADRPLLTPREQAIEALLIRGQDDPFYVLARRIAALPPAPEEEPAQIAPPPINRCSLCGGDACEEACGPRTGCRHKHDGPNSHRVCNRCGGSGRQA